MSLPNSLQDNLSLPLMASPLFIISNPAMVIEQCKAGIVGSFPALNARPAEELEVWLRHITSELEEFKAANPGRRVAPFAVNQIVHHSNTRLEHDLEMCAKYRVPITITSLKAPHQAVKVAHEYGGLVYHDVINVRHAEKALEAGVDGLILVCSGAGGHAGSLSPFALVSEVRRFYSGTIILSGAITRGEHILAAQALGADLAYMGTRFIATEEANAPAEYKSMIVDSSSVDIVNSNLFSGVHANYLRGSIVRAGLDPEQLPTSEKMVMDFSQNEGTKVKAWRDIWGAGQGVGNIHEVQPIAQAVEQLRREYQSAIRAIGERAPNRGDDLGMAA